MLARMLIASTLMLSMTACASTRPSPTAICSGTGQARAALAEALLADGGDQSKRAGLALLDKMEAGCK